MLGHNWYAHATLSEIKVLCWKPVVFCLDGFGSFHSSMHHPFASSSVTVKRSFLIPALNSVPGLGAQDFDKFVTGKEKKKNTCMSGTVAQIH